MNTNILKRDYLTLKEIEKDIKYFANKYWKNAKKIVDIWCWKKPYKHYFWNNIYIWVDIIDTWNQDIIANAWDTGLKDNEFDILVSNQSLEHIIETDKTINEIKRIVKKWWHIFISLPFLYPQHWAPYDYYRFTYYWLLHKFKDFEIIEIKQTTYYFSTLIMLINQFFWAFPYSQYIFAPIFLVNNILWIILDNLFKFSFFVLWKKFQEIHDNFVKNYSSDYCIILKNRKK